MNINESVKTVHITGEEKTWDRARLITIDVALGKIPTITMVDDRVTVGVNGTKHTELPKIVIKCDDPNRMIKAINRETGEFVGEFPIGLLDALFTGLYVEEKNK